MQHDQAVILLAEDREDDILRVQRAFAKGEITTPLFIVRDGDEAISYLSGIGKYGNRAEYPLPDLLLLDLKMPKVDGRHMANRVVWVDPLSDFRRTTWQYSQVATMRSVPLGSSARTHQPTGAVRHLLSE
jgi:hypothetical protein